MNALARYLLVFLLGWSGAVWSYSDLIYKTNKIPEKIETPEKINDISLPNALKPGPTANGELTSQSIEKATPAITLNNKQPTEEQTMSQ